MVIAVTISCGLRKIVSARSTVTEVSIARAGLVDAVDALGQPRIERVGPEQVVVFEVVLGRGHPANVGEWRRPRKRACKRPGVNRASASVRVAW